MTEFPFTPKIKQKTQDLAPAESPPDQPPEKVAEIQDNDNEDKGTLDQEIAAATLPDIEILENKIAQISSHAVRAAYIKVLAVKLKIPTKAIESDINELREETIDNSSDPKKVPSACFDNLIDLVLDDNGKPAYLVRTPHLLIDGEYTVQIEETHIEGDRIYIPPRRKDLPFSLIKGSDVIELYRGDPDLTLFMDVYRYFARFSYLTTGQNLIIVLYVFASYLQDHPQVYYLAVIFFYGDAEHGKSRTGKAATYISYRGIHLIGMREANIFRFSEDLQATIFFDMKNLWQKAQKNNCEDILLGRFEKGASVPRVLYPEKGAFEDTRYFSIFGPTIAASNEAIHKILNTRTIPVTMIDHPDDYEQPTPTLGLPLKTRLTAWRARMMNCTLPDVQPIEGVAGRLWDVSKPLLQICQIMCPEAIPTFHQYIQEVAAERAHDNSLTYEAEIVKVIRDLSPVGVQDWKLLTIAVVNCLNQDRAPQFYSHVGPIGKKLRAMGFTVKTINGKSVIFLNRHDFDLCLAKYGVDPMPDRKPGTTGFKDSNSIVDDILNSIKQ